MILKLPEGEKQWLWRFKCDIFHIFCKFSGNEVETVFRKSKWEPPKWFHFKVCQKFQKSFEATLKSKTNTLSVWKWIFEFLCTFFSEQVENDFGESKAKHTKLCKSEVGHRKRFRKWFWNYLEVKSRWTTELLKKEIFSFLHNFKPRSWNRLLWKQGKVFKSLWIQSWSW